MGTTVQAHAHTCMDMCDLVWVCKHMMGPHTTIIIGTGGLFPKGSLKFYDNDSQCDAKQCSCFCFLTLVEMHHHARIDLDPIPVFLCFAFSVFLQKVLESW